MAAPPDFGDSLNAVVLAWQLVAGETPVGCTSPVQSLAITVRGLAPTSAAPREHHHGSHPPHAPGSRIIAAAGAMSSTSGDVLAYPVVVADPTEYVKDAASDKIIDDMVFIAGQLYRVHRVR